MMFAVTGNLFNFEKVRMGSNYMIGNWPVNTSG
jgi:hypothetical protein